MCKSYAIKKIVMTKKEGMKEPWCIASSKENLLGSSIISWYAKRWDCECQFRDTKDIHFGMGLYHSRIKNSARRERIFFLNAIAM